MTVFVDREPALDGRSRAQFIHVATDADGAFSVTCVASRARVLIPTDTGGAALSMMGRSLRNRSP